MILGSFGPFWSKLVSKQCIIVATIGMQGIEETCSVPLRCELRGHLEDVFCLNCPSLIKIHPLNGLWAHIWGALNTFLQCLASNCGHHTAPFLLIFTKNTIFSRFLSCTSIYFFPGAGPSPKMVFFKPQNGNRVKKTPFWGSKWLSRKKYRGTSWGEGDHV